VLVTGASAGIGRATADRLAAAGWTVVGASRRGTGGEGPTGWAGQVMDVDDDASVAAGVATVLAEHGRIDAVVLSAGWGVAGSVERTSLAEAKAQLETNLWGAVRVVQAVLPAMREHGGGRIVLVSSLGGIISLPFQGFYSASKFALEGLAEALAWEVRPFGLHVTLIEPGNVATDFTAARRMAAAGGAADDPYAAAQAHAIEVMERDERGGVAPEQVAKAVARVLGQRRPPLRRSVGRAGERVGLVARRALPWRAFAAAAKGSLGIR
jgi:NAD(P)-dependent dehydrogenase (short-subunit alcohol dehydrogenase family)